MMETDDDNDIILLISSLLWWNTWQKSNYGRFMLSHSWKDVVHYNREDMAVGDLFLVAEASCRVCHTLDNQEALSLGRKWTQK